MRLPRPVVAWLVSRLHQVAFSRVPDRNIGTDTDSYMERWYIIPRNRIFNIYLHHFLRSDDDRALHCHPWLNGSILLTGKYTERTIAAGGVHNRIEYVAGDVKLRGAKYAHRIELTSGPCWTLFVTGPIVRVWGFHCPNGWRTSKEFGEPDNPDRIGRGCD